MSENKEQVRGTSRKAKAERGTGETIDASNGRLYYKVASSSGKRCDSSGV